MIYDQASVIFSISHLSLFFFFCCLLCSLTQLILGFITGTDPQGGWFNRAGDRGGSRQQPVLQEPRPPSGVRELRLHAAGLRPGNGSLRQQAVQESLRSGGFPDHLKSRSLHPGGDLLLIKLEMMLVDWLGLCLARALVLRRSAFWFFQCLTRALVLQRPAF